MLHKVLQALREKDGFLALYNSGMSALYQSGIFEFLRERARPGIKGLGSDIQALATSAAYSAGYNDAIEDLLNFRDLWFDTVNTKIPMNFGAVDLALAKGDLTEEEANGLKAG